MRAIYIIARLTFREAVRRRIALAALLLGLAFIVLYNTGFYFLRTDIEANGGMVETLARNEFVNFILRRAEIVLGKWMGFALLLALYFLLMAGGVMLSIWLQAGYHAPNVLAGVTLIYLNSLLIMSITLASSSAFSTLATGGIVFGLYGVGFIGGWVEQFGAFAKNQTAINVGIVSSLIIPSEALWKRAAFEMTSPLVKTLGFSPFTSASVPSPAMVIYAGLYVVMMLALAARQFSQRDL
ncbi:MAG: ABC transporter permease [Chloroflexi bacterium]|nr:ABC transporter permease [Chloroflexota bacterium]